MPGLFPGGGDLNLVLMIVQQVFLVDGTSLHPYYYKGDIQAQIIIVSDFNP